MEHNYESLLRTFENWTSPLSPEKLARAGFFYLNYQDVVQCPSCNIEGYKWEKDDDPWQDHANWSPNCPFIKGDNKPVDIPPNVEKATIQSTNLQSTDELLCKVCYSKAIEVLLVPCGHLAGCMSCANVMERCPFCRGIVQQKIRAYIP